jgi:REP element-mobilizing transposase RayT
MIWSTRNRAPWLEPGMDAWLAELLERKARALDGLLLAAGNTDDHVHVVVRHPPRVSVAQIAHRRK